MRPLARFTALAVSLVTIAFFAAPANAAVVEGAAASAAGLRAHLNILGANVLNLPPTPYAAVPDTSAENPNLVTRQLAGNIRFPADGSLIADVGALSVTARRSMGALRTARGEAVVSELALLEQAGTPLIQAELIKAVSETRCTGPDTATVSAAGSKLAGLRVGTQVFENVPPKNTTIPLVSDGGTPADPSDDRGIRVILNEQTGATSGTGLIVTMIHVLVFDAVSPNLVFADIRIAEARSTVFCSLATPPTNDNGDTRGVVSDKLVTTTTSDVRGAADGSTATVHRGEIVTWKITLRNTGTTGCGLVVVSDTLPTHFTFVSSSGDLTDGVQPTIDGQRIVWSKGSRYSLAAGATLTETIVAKVADGAPFGTYTNLIDVEQSTCSSFTQGLRGPVDVVPKVAVLPIRNLQPSEALPRTGQGTGVTALAAALFLLTAGGVFLSSTRPLGRRY